MSMGDIFRGLPLSVDVRWNAPAHQWWNSPMRTRFLCLPLLLLLCVRCGEESQNDVSRGPLEQRSVKVVSLNIAVGAGYTTKWHRDRQALFLSEQDADIIALQEVTIDDLLGDTGRDSLGELATKGTVIYGPAQNWPGGQYGNMLWVSNKHTVLYHRVIVFLDEDDSEENRAAIWALVLLNDGRLAAVLNTHLSVYGEHPAELRKKQLEKIGSLWVDIAIGDFNAKPSEVAPYMGALKMTAPDSIDQIWAREGTGVIVPTDVTDHLHAVVSVLP